MKALLIGCATYGLEAPNNDVRQLAAALEPRGFQNPVRLVGKRATRAGILSAYQHLIETADTDEPTLIYYSGHGALVPNPLYQAHGEDGRPHHFQFILPTDYKDSTEDDFRGILDVELSHLLAQLTDRTTNVVVILDCCHSTFLSRDPRFQARTPQDMETPGLSRTFEGLTHAKHRRYPDGNPHAVRLSACGVFEQAFEYYGSQGHIGLFTEGLTRMLQQSPTVSWSAMMQWVREYVLAIKPEQRPDMEGPEKRAVFSQQEGAPRGVFPIFMEGDTFILRAGRLHGVTMGNVYALQPRTHHQYIAHDTLATVEVAEVFAGRSRLNVLTGQALRGLRAFPLREHFPQQPVALACGAAPTLAQALNQENRLTLHTADHLPPLATITHGFTIRDGDGDTTVLPDQQQTLVFLNRCAHVRALRTLSSEQPPSSYQFLWGRVEEGQPKPMTDRTLHVEDRLFASLHNRGDTLLYFHLFYISLDKEIIRLTQPQLGLNVGPGELAYVGYQPSNGFANLRVVWSPLLPSREARAAHLTAIVSNSPHDLSALAHRTREHRTSLERLMSHLVGGSTRERSTGDPAGYAVEHIPLVLSPMPRIQVKGGPKPPSH